MSKIFRHLTQEAGAKKTFQWYLKTEQTDKQTDTQTDKQNFDFHGVNFGCCALCDAIHPCF